MHDSMPFNQNLEAVRQRHEWLTPIYPLFELVFILPRGIRSRAVDWLALKAGDRLRKHPAVAGSPVIFMLGFWALIK
jgi:hypothetical protein